MDSEERKGNCKMNKKSIKVILAGLLAIPVIAFSVGLVVPMNTGAVAGIQNGANSAQGSGTPTNLFGGDDAIFSKITNTALFLIGAISVIMLIYGGIRYTISGGTEKSVTAAKNTILYAVVGIVVALLAFALVNFVINNIGA